MKKSWILLLRCLSVSLFLGAVILLPFDALAQGHLVGPANSGLPGGSIYWIIATMMYYLLAILGFIAIIGFVIAGILYLTAAGRDDQIKQAKTAMMYSIIGVIVALVGYVVIQAVDLWLRGFWF